MTAAQGFVVLAFSVRGYNAAMLLVARADTLTCIERGGGGRD